jgi:hypothetical protein
MFIHFERSGVRALVRDGFSRCVGRLSRLFRLGACSLVPPSLSRVAVGFLRISRPPHSAIAAAAAASSVAPVAAAAHVEAADDDDPGALQLLVPQALAAETELNADKAGTNPVQAATEGEEPYVV